MTVVDPGNPDTGSFAVAQVTDGSPLDPLYGTMGAAVYYERLDQVDPAPGAATSIAQSRLRTLAGAVHTMTLKCVPQPWMQPGDVIGVEYNGTVVYAQVAAWSMDLGDRSEMTVRLRAWRVASDVDLPTYPEIPAGAMSINQAQPIGVEAPPQPPPKPPAVEIPVGDP